MRNRPASGTMPLPGAGAAPRGSGGGEAVQRKRHRGYGAFGLAVPVVRRQKTW